MNKFTYCELPATPWGFNIEKFKAGDEKQEKLYKTAKVPNRDKPLTYKEITDEEKKPNYARVVPKDCCFIDYDNKYEFERIKEIILKAKSNCLILDTPHGGQFLYRKPSFYKKEMTKATNWLGMKFDTKGSGAVQIMRVCGMDRKEICSWDGKEVMLEELEIEELDILPYWLWGKLSNKDLHKGGKPRKKRIHSHRHTIYTVNGNGRR